jgi:putative transposase
VLTGIPPGALPGTAPRPEYDPRRRSLRQRELAKHAELTVAGQKVALSTLKRVRRRYELEGAWGLALFPGQAWTSRSRPLDST